MARPTKYSEEKSAAIVRALQAGATRIAAAEHVGISYECFRLWMVRKLDFFALVTRAEAECEVQYTAVMKKAAQGYDAGTTTRTTKTVFKTRKSKLPDGTVVEEPIAMQEVTEAVTSSREFDWRPAESWLKRRRRVEWGDSIDIRKLDDDTLLRLLALEGGSEETRVITDESVPVE